MNITQTIGEDRVRNASSNTLNNTIDQQIKENIAYYATQDEATIKHRIKELEKEWDVERTLELNASLLSLGGVILAATVNKKWLFLPGIVTSFLAQHALQGWCPPLPLFRKMGTRTRQEIDAERYELMKLISKGKAPRKTQVKSSAPPTLND